MPVRTQVELDSTGRGFELRGQVRDFKCDSKEVLDYFGKLTFNEDGSVEEIKHDSKYKQEFINGLWIISKAEKNK
ncbi:MAG: hypothetical protein Q4F12_02440 [Erysipelotrichaceae bacterium]|nr:hypothetical protein [Erysipelotrichaceae bacterium]